MHKNLILTNTGGLPFDQDILAFMQDSYGLFNSLGWLAGNYAILYGCTTSGKRVTDGVVFIDGEVLPFKGGTGNKVIIKQSETKLTFEDGGNKKVEVVRYATFGSNSKAIAWSEFVRVKNNQQLSKEIINNTEIIKNISNTHTTNEGTIEQRVEKLEQRLKKTIPIGLVAIWGQYAKDIPEGWREYTGLRECVPVGYDPNYKQGNDRTNYKLNQKGYHGGKREHKLSKSELPSFNIRVKGQWGGDNSDHNNFSAFAGGDKGIEETGFYFYKDVEFDGGDKPHTNMQPYKVVEFIEFIGFN